MTAWEEFALTLTKNNVWGVPRKVSGFEAYNMANLNLVNSGLPAIDTPEPLNSWPSLANCFLLAPSENQYQPSYALYPWGKFSGEVPNGYNGELLMDIPQILNEPIPLGLEEAEALTLSIGFYYNKRNPDILAIPWQTLFGDSLPEPNDFSIVIFFQDYDVIDISVNIKDSNELLIKYKFESITVENGFNNLSLYLPFNKGANPLMSINGETFVGDVDGDLDLFQSNETFSIVLLQNGSNKTMPVGLTSFIAFSDRQSPALFNRLTNGYIPNTWGAGFSISKSDKGKILFLKEGGIAQPIDLPVESEWSEFGQSIDMRFSPLISVFNPNGFAEGFVYKIQVLGNISFGVSSPRGQWRTLAYIHGDGSLFCPIGEEYAAAFYMARNLQTAFCRIVMIDPTNGVASAPTLIGSTNVGLDVVNVSALPACSDTGDLYECAHAGPGPRHCACPVDLEQDVMNISNQTSGGKNKVKFKAGSSLSGSV